MADTPPATDPGMPAAPADPEQQREELAQLDRKLGIRTYAGAAAVILALATAIVAVVLAVDARDNSATDADLNRVEKALGGVADDASAFGDAQDDIDALGSRLDELENEVSGLSGADSDAEGRLDVVEDDIEDLRQEISDLANAAETSSGGSGPADGGE